MPQLLASGIQPQHLQVPLRELLPGAAVYTYEIEHVDVANRKVRLSRGREGDEVILEFDYLLLALGSIPNLARIPGLVEHGLPAKTLGDFFHLRNHLIELLENAAVESREEDRRRLLTVVVAGAGYAGVEVAAEASALVHDALRFYPGIPRHEVRFLLVDVAPQLLPTLREELAQRARRYLEEHGVELRLGSGLAGVSAREAMLVGGERVPTSTVIATAGTGPNPLLAQLPVTLTGSRIRCDEFCRVTGQPQVYAAGDNAAIPNPRTGKSCPPMLLYAISQGEQAAANILAELRGEPLRPFAYERRGELVFLAKGYALAELAGRPVHGALAGLVGRWTFLSYLPNWRRRAALMLDWLRSALFPPDITQLRLARTDALIPVRFAAGEVIVREGELATRFYIITEGAVEVVQQGPSGSEAPLRRLGPGGYFGEIALLGGGYRTATVRALTDTLALSIARQDFNTLATHLPGLRDALATGEPAAGPRPG
jgi:NADH dehydrogenase